MYWLILSVYFLLLSVLPCMEKGDACNVVAIEATEKGSHNDDSHDKEDNCSPFCSCTCCQLVLQPVQMTAAPPVPFSFIDAKSYSLPAGNVFGFAASVWQPPRTVVLI